MLLATDLDGTFLGGSAEDRLTLYQLIAAQPKIRLAFVTGRGLESVLPLLADPTLPNPDYIICDVGGTVVDGSHQLPIQPLQARIDDRWPGEQTVAEAMARFPSLQRQEVPQARRCSYFCEAGAITEDVLGTARSLGCEVLFSADRYLDILPAGVNKGSTLAALVAQLGLSPDEVLVAGDTLNDLSMYEQPFFGVCVGESEPALLNATQSRARVLQATRPGAGGILDALSHFGFLGRRGIAAETRTAVTPGTSELVVVYHRLPYEETHENGEIRRRRPRSPNGIIPTLMGFFAGNRAGSWVAWAEHEDPGDGRFETHTEVDAERYPKLVAARVPLNKTDVDVFYRRFSKEAFWPMLHTFWERASFNEDHWQIFLRVNRRFAEVTAREAAHGALVWIHDYNLWMVPAFLRELRPDVRIAFFHHTHFPSADVFNVVPWRRAIVGSLLACDYVGFHIPRQVENFVDVARGVMPVTLGARRNCAPRFLTYGCAVGLDQVATQIKVGERTVRLGAHPVGLDVGRVRDALDQPRAGAQMADLRKEFAGFRVILSVERLDYTKGTLEKLLAYERLLEGHPELWRKLKLVVVCVPAAREMTVYDTLVQQIEQAVGRINGRFSQSAWTPIQFFFRSLPFEELVAYYAIADVMWITPLRDGLNLVCKEYVAVQGLTRGRGVLVLSEFAGAAAELKGALLTNPHDLADLAGTCYQAIAMAGSEARARLAELYAIVCHNDIQRWGSEFLAAANGDTARAVRARSRARAPTP